jgi:hypothetical protein
VALTSKPTMPDRPDPAQPFTLDVEDIALDVAYHHGGGETDGVHYDLDGDGQSLTVTATRLADGAVITVEYKYAGPTK